MTCPLRHSFSVPWYKPTTGFQVCLQCGLVYRDPMPTAAELEAIYTHLYSLESLARGDTAMLSEEAATQALAEYLVRRIPPRSRILDFGAGTGQLLKLLRDAGNTVVGVESAPEPRRVATTKFDLEMLSGIDDVDASSFDFVLAVEVLEHLPRPAATLTALLRVLRPGGGLFLSTPNVRGASARFHRQDWREAVKPFHLVLFDDRSLTTMLQGCGYHQIEPIRFSPLTASNLVKRALHRVLQATNLYGGLRYFAWKPVVGGARLP